MSQTTRRTGPLLLLCLLGALHLCRPESPVRAGEPLRWSVRDAVTYALVHNPEVAVSRNRVEELKEQQGEVFANFLPNLDFEAGYKYINNVPQIDINFNLPTTPPSRFTKVVEVGANDNYSLQVALNQILFASGRVFFAHRAAEKQVTAGGFQEDSVKLNVARQAAEVYHGVRISASIVTVQQEALEAARAHQEQVRNRFDAGAATRLELLRSQVEVSNLVSGVTEAEKNRETAMTLFRRITGLPEDARVTLTDPAFATARPPGSEELLETALGSRPELKALEQNRSALEDQALAARGRMLPALNLFGSFTVQKPYFSLVEWEKIFTVGAGISVPLFDGLSAYRGMRRARAAAETVSLTAAQTRADVRTQVETALLELREAEVRTRTTEENVGSALQMLSIAESTYAAGAATSLEVIDAQLAATRARLDQLKALYDYRIACVRLAYATDDLEAISREEAWQSESYPSS
jgi:outer membrane protein